MLKIITLMTVLLTNFATADIFGPRPDNREVWAYMEGEIAQAGLSVRQWSTRTRYDKGLVSTFVLEFKIYPRHIGNPVIYTASFEVTNEPMGVYSGRPLQTRWIQKPTPVGCTQTLNL